MQKSYAQFMVVIGTKQCFFKLACSSSRSPSVRPGNTQYKSVMEHFYTFRIGYLRSLKGWWYIVRSLRNNSARKKTRNKCVPIFNDSLHQNGNFLWNAVFFYYFIYLVLMKASVLSNIVIVNFLVSFSGFLCILCLGYLCSKNARFLSKMADRW